MADIDYLLSLKGLPTFEAILKLYDEYRKQTPSSRPGELRKIGSGSDAFNRTQRFLTSIRLPKSLMRTDGQGGVLLEPDLAESLFRCIEDIVGDLDRLFAISSQTPSQLSVVLATSQLLGTRPLPPWLREFHSGFESQRGLAGIGDAVPAPRVSMAYAQPYDLTDEFLRDPHVDLVLTYCDPLRKFDDGVQLARVNLHRCMLVRMDHEFAARKESLRDRRWIQFST
jgi:DNA-binding transcriptional LysR family regulator